MGIPGQNLARDEQQQRSTCLVDTNRVLLVGCAEGDCGNNRTSYRIRFRTDVNCSCAEAVLLVVM